MSDTPSRQFVSACLAGEAFEGDIDEWVEAWHETAGAPLGTPIPLHEYLGMSDDEYALWVEQPSALRLTITARRYGLDVRELLEGRSDYALAARAATTAPEVQKVLEWLVNSGQLPRSQSEHDLN